MSNPFNLTLYFALYTGGALATLLAVRVRHENIFPAEAVQLFTFGSPRVGNGAFALYASDKILTRFVVFMPTLYTTYIFNICFQTAYNLFIILI
mgnify:CR=1 FL=1